MVLPIAPNARLTKVTADAPLADAEYRIAAKAEASDESTRWDGDVGAFVAPEKVKRESSQVGRDVVTERIVYIPDVAVISIGDQIDLTYEGDEVTWTVAGCIKHGVGIEVFPYWELKIDAA